MKKLNKITAGLACLALSAGVMAQGVTDDEVLLGTSTALSGPAALWGVAASQAAQIRFDMVNENGGVHGRQIRVVLEDHQYQVPIHVKAMNKLLNLDKVFATFNVLGTPMNLATAETQFAKNVPMLLPMTTAHSVQDPEHDLKLTFGSSYYNQIRFAVGHFLATGRTSACVMYQDSAYGAEVLEAVTDEVAEHGGVSLVSSVSHKPTATEFVGAMVGFKGAGCDLIVFGTIIRDTITGYATARKLGITADVVVTQAGFDTMVAGFPGGITEGLYAASVGEAVYCDSAPASAKAFCDAYKAKYGSDPGVSGQLGYTAADLVVAGLENAGADLTVESLMDGLEAISGHPDTFGRISWSYGADDHKGTQVVVLSQVKDGKWVSLGQANYSAK